MIQYEHRPFQTAGEMDDALISNWNRKVSPEDDIYILGDFTLKGPPTGERAPGTALGAQISDPGEPQRLCGPDFLL